MKKRAEEWRQRKLEGEQVGVPAWCHAAGQPRAARGYSQPPTNNEQPLRYHAPQERLRRLPPDQREKEIERKKKIQARLVWA